MSTASLMIRPVIDKDPFSSRLERPGSVRLGSSFTASTVKAYVATFESPVPSLTFQVKLSSPKKSASGV